LALLDSVNAGFLQVKLCRSVRVLFGFCLFGKSGILRWNCSCWAEISGLGCSNNWHIIRQFTFQC